jgi:hypothetical protein
MGQWDSTRASTYAVLPLPSKSKVVKVDCRSVAPASRAEADRDGGGYCCCLIPFSLLPSPTPLLLIFG